MFKCAACVYHFNAQPDCIMEEIPSLLYLKQVVCFQNNNIARNPSLLTLNLLEDFWDFPSGSFSELMHNNGAFVVAWRLIKPRHLSRNLRFLFEENQHLYFSALREQWGRCSVVCYTIFGKLKCLWPIIQLRLSQPHLPSFMLITLGSSGRAILKLCTHIHNRETSEGVETEAS